MEGADDRLGKQLFEGRFSVWACLCGLILAWALTSALKAADRMPAHSSGAVILVGVATLFVVIGCCFAFVLRLRRRMAHLPVLLLRCAAMLFRMEAERGYSKSRTTGGRIRVGRIGAWKGAAGRARRPTSGGVIPPGVPTIPLVGGDRFLLGMGGSNREQSRPPGGRDCSLLLPFVAPYCSLLLPIAPFYSQ
jgi:hypothetical protein